MKKLTKRDFQEFLLLTLGTALVSAGVYFFKFPNHFSMGGVSGLAVLLGELFPHAWLSPSVFNTLINLLFLVLGFLLLDKGFGLKTVYCSLLYSGLVQVFEWIWPLSAPLTDELILELFFAVILPALGSGILFNLDASTGGTDIAAMILKKYTGLDVGRALLCSDIAIAAAALLVFDVTAGLCSLLGLVLKSVLVDNVIESLNRRKAFIIVTSHPEVACGYITDHLIRGATLWDAEGAYTHKEHHIVLTVLSAGLELLDAGPLVHELLKLIKTKHCRESYCKGQADGTNNHPSSNGNLLYADPHVEGAAGDKERHNKGQQVGGDLVISDALDNLDHNVGQESETQGDGHKGRHNSSDIGHAHRFVSSLRFSRMAVSYVIPPLVFCFSLFLIKKHCTVAQPPKARAWPLVSHGSAPV